MTQTCRSTGCSSRSGLPDADLKDEATAVLAELGLTVPDIVRMTLTRVAKDLAVPLELKVPNAETRAAMEESRRLMRKRNARFNIARDLFNALDRDSRKR
ncbi:MAG TPA: type II toxin-antitoxin system RelB/DinJ family antitoxin [Rhizomicrobium sp.]|nr:type II toxin-antitoxin system RelB/DinJ family antitoxin [Rhizomicrobium sp.]